MHCSWHTWLKTFCSTHQFVTPKALYWGNIKLLCVMFLYAILRITYSNYFKWNCTLCSPAIYLSTVKCYIELLKPYFFFLLEEWRNRASFVRSNVLSVFFSTDFLLVSVAPQLSCPVELKVTEGERFLCEVTGNPEPSVTWFKNGQIVVPPSHLNKKDAGNYTIQAKGLFPKNFTVEVKILPATGRFVCITTEYT